MAGSLAEPAGIGWPGGDRFGVGLLFGPGLGRRILLVGRLDVPRRVPIGIVHGRGSEMVRRSWVNRHHAGCLGDGIVAGGGHARRSGTVGRRRQWPH